MTLPSHGLDTCRHCRQPIRWTITAASRRQAVNPEPDSTGNTVAYLDGLSRWRSRVPTAELPRESYEKQFMPHVATCLRGPKAVSESRLPPGVASLNARRRLRRKGVR